MNEDLQLRPEGGGYLFICPYGRMLFWIVHGVVGNGVSQRTCKEILEHIHIIIIYRHI